MVLFNLKNTLVQNILVIIHKYYATIIANKVPQMIDIKNILIIKDKT